MSSNRRFGSMREFLTMFGDTVAVTSAVRAHTRPDAASLRRLGIDPEQFAKIGRF